MPKNPANTTQRVSSAMYLQHHQALDPGYSPAVTTELGDLVTGFGLEWELVEVLEEPLDLSVVISQKDYEAEIIECGTDACRCEVSPYWAKVLYDIDCDDIRIHYCWSVAEIPQEAVAGLREYHPDYASAKLSTGLGNTEFITNASGRAHQFFFYSPCSRRDCEPAVKLARPSPAPQGTREGEALEVHSANSGYNSPYRFNSKEWDEETGNYYYGARYYDPKVSVWLSVDPLAHKFPSQTPYNYVFNNPLNLIDPTGMGPETYLMDEDGQTCKVDNQQYARNTSGEVRELAEGEELRDGEELVDKYIGTDQKTGEKESVYVRIRKVKEREQSYEDNYGRAKDGTYTGYAAGSHEDAMEFMEFAFNVTTVEFGYQLKEDKYGGYSYNLGTLGDPGATTVISPGGRLVYDLHINPDDISVQDAQAAWQKGSGFFEALTKDGYKRYEPCLRCDAPTVGRAQASSGFKFSP